MEFTGSKSVITPEGVFIIGTYERRKAREKAEEEANG